ncbi:MAG TPA: amidohydrolase [Thermoplasmata archaeon]|nr:amidohydrolase [Thermoplasmata archaeon]
MIEKVVEGKVYVGGRFVNCCIGVEGGKIKVVKKVLKGEKTIRFSKGLILPAAIDVHVHFRDPGFPEKEDFSTGTTAAAFGGVSCVLDMPNTKPPTNTIEACKEKIAIAERKTFVDFGIYGGVVPGNLDKLIQLSEVTTAFKVYLGESTNREVLEEDILSILASKTITKVVAFHAEDAGCLAVHAGKEDDLSDHAMRRPSECERKAVEKILKTFSSFSTIVHICHISSSAALQTLSDKSENFTVGVTPHHLLFKADDELPQPTHYKVNPPLRASVDQKSLWNALISGGVDVIESDHAPHTMEEKEQNFATAPSGVPGTETMLPVMFHQFMKRNIPISRLISLLCEKPANIFSLPKGRIEVGKDADLIVVNPKNVKRIKADDLHSRCGWSPFEGIYAVFPIDVFVRGERVIEERELVGKQGFGRFIGG